MIQLREFWMDLNQQSMRNKSPTTKFTRDKKLNVLVNSHTDNKKLLMPLVPLRPLKVNSEHAPSNKEKPKLL